MMDQLTRLNQSHEVVTACLLVSIMPLLHNRNLKQRHAVLSSIFPSSGLLGTNPGRQRVFLQGILFVSLERMGNRPLHGVLSNHTVGRGNFVECSGRSPGSR
jgi:hypothetical protein